MVRSSPQDEEEDEDSDEEDELPDVAKGASDEGAEEEEGGSSQAGERACLHSPGLFSFRRAAFLLADFSPNIPGRKTLKATDFDDEEEFFLAGGDAEEAKRRKDWVFSSYAAGGEGEEEEEIDPKATAKEKKEAVRKLQKETERLLRERRCIIPPAQIQRKTVQSLVDKLRAKAGMDVAQAEPTYEPPAPADEAVPVPLPPPAAPADVNDAEQGETPVAMSDDEDDDDDIVIIGAVVDQSSSPVPATSEDSTKDDAAPTSNAAIVSNGEGRNAETDSSGDGKIAEAEGGEGKARQPLSAMTSGNKPQGRGSAFATSTTAGSMSKETKTVSSSGSSGSISKESRKDSKVGEAVSSAAARREMRNMLMQTVKRRSEHLSAVSPPLSFLSSYHPLYFPVSLPMLSHIMYN